VCVYSTVYDTPVPMADLDGPGGGYGMLDMGSSGFDDPGMMHMGMPMQQPPSHQQHPRPMPQTPQRLGPSGPHHMMQDPMATGGHPHLGMPHDQMTAWFDPDM
jgi:hypothetical protein